ncbi:spherulin-2A-like [Galleria mellonella]|uniref:Spherulin-2A-like n=1 Tax=Galleria mellonella TaxID=7137 RepID=A0ABM3M9T4_GALME|nr:spherulin-2A-like [Galleria mellonella]
MAVLLLFLLPSLALANIQVQVSGKFNADDPSSMRVYTSGNQVGIISDEERNTFELNDNNLKNSVRSYFGLRPDDAFLRSPTPWGDLYKTYGWSQVARTLEPRNGKILKITSKPVIVLEQIFENNSSKPALFNVGISQTVENTVSSSWSKGGELSVGQEINYGFDIEVANGGGTTSLSYTSSFGENTEKSESVTVGASSAMEILLQPGQVVVASLQATRGYIQVEIEYDASLNGQSAVNYADTFKGHHFWALDIRAVMSSGGLSNSKVSKETITIGFYSNSKVVVLDKNYGNKIMELEC